MYFEWMLFLIPQTQDRATSSNYSPMTAMEKKTLMKDGRMKQVQMMVEPKLTRVERNRAKDKLWAAFAGHPEGEE